VITTQNFSFELFGLGRWFWTFTANKNHNTGFSTTWRVSLFYRKLLGSNYCKCRKNRQCLWL